MALSAIDTGDGPPAVLLHGQPGNSADWSPVTDRLRGRLRVIAPDRPGYGRTGGRAAGFRENAEAVVALLDRLGVDSAVVAAHSWASGVALAMAAAFPERVRALVLAAPVAPGMPPDPFDRLLAHRLIGAPVTRAGFWLCGVGLAIPPVRRVAQMTVPGLSRDQVDVKAAEWRADHVWRSFYEEQRVLLRELPSLEPELGSIEQPTSLIYGTWDLVARPAHARRLARELAHAELIAAPRAGHMLPQQRPRVVAEAIAGAALGAVEQG